LANADQFLKSLLTIPGLNFTLEVNVFISNFPVKLGEIRGEVTTLLNAFNTLSASATLPKIFELILVFGNCLNTNKASGNAKAFKLETLSKLGDTKSSQTARKNLFHSLVNIIEQQDASLLQLKGEFVELPVAMKYSLASVSSQFMAIKETFRKFQTLKVEGLKPSFTEKLDNFFKKSENELTDLEELIVTTQKAYTHVLEVYGESDFDTPIPAEDMLKLFNNFIEDLSRAHADLIKERELEAKRKAKEKLKQAELEKKNALAPKGKDNGVIDKMLSNMQSGNFSASRTDLFADVKMEEEK